MEIDPEHEKKRCKNVVIKNEMKIPRGQQRVIVSGKHVLRKSIQKSLVCLGTTRHLY